MPMTAFSAGVLIELPATCRRCRSVVSDPAELWFHAQRRCRLFIPPDGGTGSNGEEDVNKMKHTPGPWHVVTAMNGKVRRIESDERTDEPGAVRTIVRENGFGMPGCDVGKANARLIAAAPDLLAACYLALQDYRLDNWTKDVIRAAVAKATGETTRA